MKKGYNRQTIYNQINRLKNDSPIQNSKRTGRPTTWTAPPRVQKLKRLTNNRHGISQRQLSKKFDMDQSSICRKLSKMNIKYRKREKTPKYCAVQRVKAQKLARKLVYELYKSKAWLVMDDEKYFCWEGDLMPGNAGYGRQRNISGESVLPEKRSTPTNYWCGWPSPSVECQSHYIAQVEH